MPSKVIIIVFLFITLVESNGEFHAKRTIPELGCLECILSWLGEQVEVKCGIKQSNQTIVLFKNGHQLDNVTYKYLDSGLSLVIYNFYPKASDDNVPFGCSVNGQEIYSNLKVLRRPSIPSIGFDGGLREGADNTITCTSLASQPVIPAIGLTLNGSQVPEQSWEPTVASATFKVNLSRYDINRTVTCCSTYKLYRKSNVNSSRTDCTNATLDVYYPPDMVKLKKTIKYNRVNGDTKVILNCTVGMSNPCSVITWRKVKNINRKVLDNNTCIGQSHVGGYMLYNVLQLQLTSSDNGKVIRCEVDNLKFPALDMAATFTANITYEPIISLSGGATMTTYVDDPPVIIRCNANANPKPTISWHTADGELIDSEDDVSFMDLEVTNTSVAGVHVYTCFALNAIGSMKNASVTLTVKEDHTPTERPPSGPSAVTVAMCIVAALGIVIFILVIIAYKMYWKRKSGPGLEKSNSVRVHIQQRQPSIHAPMEGPVYSNASNQVIEPEAPVYAAVVPKSGRGTKKVDDSGLIYADLELTTTLQSQRPKTPPNEPTEYMSIDFVKTGMCHQDNDAVYSNT